MAYDLFYQRQTPRNFARESLPAIPKRALFLGLTVAGLAHLLPYAIRQGEVHYYRQKLADQRADITQEMPAISMYDLMKARKYQRAA
jgi:hypothetical protein